MISLAQGLERVFWPRCKEGYSGGACGSLDLRDGVEIPRGQGGLSSQGIKERTAPREGGLEICRGFSGSLQQRAHQPVRLSSSPRQRNRTIWKEL